MVRQLLYLPTFTLTSILALDTAFERVQISSSSAASTTEMPIIQEELTTVCHKSEPGTFRCNVATINYEHPCIQNRKANARTPICQVCLTPPNLIVRQYR